MEAVVTGAAGFIGSHLVAALRDARHRVLGIDRRPGPGTDVVVDIASRGSRALLRDAIRHADAVFHLAARPGVRDDAPDSEAQRAADNVGTARHVLELTPPGVPVVVTSSSAVYGGAVRTVSGYRPSHEDDPLRPRGGYACRKAEVERLCALRRRGGGCVTVVRPFTVGGERQRSDMALARFLSAATAGRPIELLGSARSRRDITDVRDVVRGLVAIVETGYVGTLNLGTGIAHTLEDVVAHVVAAVGRPVEIVRKPAHADDVTATLAATRRCEEVLGFVPATDLPALIRRQIGSACATWAGGQTAR